ncbi:MAG: hypothetical protein LVQ75_04910 [Candidatus Babeliales bacterium]|jgi:hypothetical protein
MLKKIILVSTLLQSFMQANQALSQLELKDVPFGYSQEQVLKEAEKVAWTVTVAQAKKYGSRALFATALGLYAYRVLSKNIPENCVLVQVAPPVDQGWVTWTIQNAVSLGGKAVEGIATQSLAAFYFSVLPQYNITCDTQWFFNKKTHLKTLTDSIAEALALLPLLEDKQQVEYQVVMITQKMQLLTKELMRLFGFLHYSHQQQEHIATFNAVCMAHVIKNLEATTQKFCQTFYQELTEYQSVKDDIQAKASKATCVNATFTHYVQALYSDIKTFIIYEKH